MLYVILPRRGIIWPDLQFIQGIFLLTSAACLFPSTVFVCDPCRPATHFLVGEREITNK